MKRLWRWLIPLAALPVLALLAYGFRVSPRDIPSPLLERTAPAFALTTLDGAPLTLAAYRGKVVVLNFWASWCYPGCYEEAPILEQNWRAYRERGVVVLGVAIQDRREAPRNSSATSASPSRTPRTRRARYRWTTACSACRRPSS